MLGGSHLTGGGLLVREFAMKVIPSDDGLWDIPGSANSDPVSVTANEEIEVDDLLANLMILLGATI
jgi:hypothetical protein|tara:strand:+ start:788 stop:985 length:198 start_codon:yes stop_codon:yes gene_type:complete